MRTRLFRLFLIAPWLIPFLAIPLTALQPAPISISPTTVTLKKTGATLGEVAADLTRTSGIPVSTTPAKAQEKCAVDFSKVPFWEAIEQVNRQMGTRVVLAERGTKVILEPRGLSQEVSCVSGPFRVVAKQVIGRALLDIGTTFHEVYLEVNWEPRIPVFRIDSQPRITKAVGNRDGALTVPVITASTYPTEALTDMKIRVNGLTRESKQIAILAGEFRVTAAEKMLPFKFANLNEKLPISKTENGVTVTLKEIARPDNTWDVKLELQYPSDHPAFESFEEQKWLRDNRIRLVAPNGAKTSEPESEEIGVHGHRVVATYRFPGTMNPRAAGWALSYETPGPLMEFKVPFELKNIPIP